MEVRSRGRSSARQVRSAVLSIFRCTELFWNKDEDCSFSSEPNGGNWHGGQNSEHTFAQLQKYDDRDVAQLHLA